MRTVLRYRPVPPGTARYRTPVLNSRTGHSGPWVLLSKYPTLNYLRSSPALFLISFPRIPLRVRTRLHGPSDIFKDRKIPTQFGVATLKCWIPRSLTYADRNDGSLETANPLTSRASQYEARERLPGASQPSGHCPPGTRPHDGPGASTPEYSSRHHQCERSRRRNRRGTAE